MAYKKTKNFVNIYIKVICYINQLLHAIPISYTGNQEKFWNSSFSYPFQNGQIETKKFLCVWPVALVLFLVLLIQFV